MEFVQDQQFVRKSFAFWRHMRDKKSAIVNIFRLLICVDLDKEGFFS